MLVIANHDDGSDEEEEAEGGAKKIGNYIPMRRYMKSYFPREV